jgi:hypothetical protein
VIFVAHQPCIKPILYIVIEIQKKEAEKMRRWEERKGKDKSTRDMKETGGVEKRFILIYIKVYLVIY